MIPLLFIPPAQETFAGWATPTVLQSAYAGGEFSASAVQVVSTQAVVIGKRLLTIVAFQSTTARVTSVTDSQSNVWTRLGQRAYDQTNQNWIEAWTAVASASGTLTITVNKTL